MKYLGFPLNLSSLTIAGWKDLLNNLKKRLQNWSLRVLNAPSQVILLQFVLQAIPIYQLSGRAAPKTICNNMVKVFKNFLWKGAQYTHKWALLSWEKLTKTKKAGGLGLRDPYVLNQVMGVKLWWRWLQGGSDLWKLISEIKYDMPITITGKMKVDVTPNGSNIWNLTAINRDLIRQHSF